MVAGTRKEVWANRNDNNAPEVPFYSPKTPSSQLPFPIYPLLTPSDPQVERISEEVTEKKRMDDGRRGDVMPLELAMKRESAYRKKVEMMLSQLYGGESREDPFSSQVPSSSPSSGPSLSGTKRKTPTRTSQCLPPQQLQLLYGSHTLGNRKDDLFCKVCQVACPSSFHLKQHLIGQKHKDTLDLKSGRNIREEEANTRKWCDLCKIWCINKYSLEQHFKSKKHQDNVQELELGGKEGQRKTNRVKLYCELCKLWCMDEYAFNQHLKGKKHVLNLHASEEKRTAKGKGLAVDQSSTRKN